MDIESALYDSGSNSGRDNLLKKCRNKMQSLEDELEKIKKIKSGLERKLSDSAKIEENYQDEILKKNFIIASLSKEISDTETKSQSALKKNFNLLGDLEKSNSIIKNMELEIQNQNEYIEELKNEIEVKNEMIKEWNQAMENVEKKINYLNEENLMFKQESGACYSKYQEAMDENREIRYLWTQQHQKNDELVKEVIRVTQEKELVSQKLSNLKEKLNSSELEIENKGNQIKQYIESIQDSKTQIRALELENAEIKAKYNVSQEELKAYKAKAKSLEKLLKDEAFKNQKEIESMTLASENKYQLFNEDNEKKISIISNLERELLSYREEQERLISTNSMLQDRYNDLNSKYKEKKQLINYIKAENNKLSNSVEDIKLLMQEKYLLKTCHLEELEEKDKEYKIKIETISAANHKKIEEYESEVSSLRSEIMKSRDTYFKVLKTKEQEIIVLNDDRNKLQDALVDLEQKVIDISGNLESSVSDCWKLSKALTKTHELQKEEIVKITQYYKKLYEKNIA